MDLHLRIHQEALTSEDVLKQMLRKYCESWYWAYEVEASRDHHQIYLRTKPEYKSENSFREIVRKNCIKDGCKGNTAYGISPVRGVQDDPDDPVVVLVCYLMKEGRTKESQNMYVDVLRQAEARQARIVAAKDERKKKKGTVLQRILDEIDYVPSDPAADKDLATKIVKWHIGEKRLVPDQYMLKKYITTIRMYKEPDKVGQYVDSICRMWDPWGFVSGC